MAGYTYGPSENELVINITSQILARLSSSFSTTAALAPTRRDENVLGYDVDVLDLLGIVLQFKRPSVVHHRTLPSKISQSTPSARFQSNIQQWITLLANFDRGQALYAIPPVHTGNELHKALDKTVFVDAHGVLPGTSLLYCPNQCCTPGGKTLVEGKIKDRHSFDGPKYVIPPAFVYCWEDVSTGLVEGNLGLKFYEADPNMVGQEDLPAAERRRVTAQLRDLRDRLDNYAKGNREAVLERVEMMLRYWRKQHQEVDVGQLQPTATLFEQLRAADALPVDDNRKFAVDEAISEVCNEVRSEASLSPEDGSEFHPATHALQTAEAELCMLGSK
ncbi:hypothetical protein [Salinigranum marinum]|uniref:hypothetical protein n=1 Tax=Salinigranum marinum TaxID=1515595 RepID=UPI00298A0630|nr:hypothetical protein [Salinigranum marinum]